MDEEKFQKTYWIGTVINCMLTLTVFVGTVFELLKEPAIIHFYVALVEMGLLFYYVIAGFKKPHGNLLRYIIWIFVLFLMFLFSGAVMMQNQISAILLIVLISVTSYVSGRLNKIKQNMVLFILLFIINIVFNFMVLTDGYTGMAPDMVFVYFITSILWLDITFAYILRYHMHKEAAFE